MKMKTKKRYWIFFKHLRARQQKEEKQKLIQCSLESNVNLKTIVSSKVLKRQFPLKSARTRIFKNDYAFFLMKIFQENQCAATS